MSPPPTAGMLIGPGIDPVRSRDLLHRRHTLVRGRPFDSTTVRITMENATYSCCKEIAVELTVRTLTFRGNSSDQRERVSHPGAAAPIWLAVLPPCGTSLSRPAGLFVSGCFIAACSGRRNSSGGGCGCRSGDPDPQAGHRARLGTERFESRRDGTLSAGFGARGERSGGARAVRKDLRRSDVVLRGHFVSGQLPSTRGDPCRESEDGECEP